MGERRCFDPKSRHRTYARSLNAGADRSLTYRDNDASSCVLKRKGKIAKENLSDTTD